MAPRRPDKGNMRDEMVRVGGTEVEPGEWQTADSHEPDLSVNLEGPEREGDPDLKRMAMEDAAQIRRDKEDIIERLKLAEPGRLQLAETTENVDFRMVNPGMYHGTFQFVSEGNVIPEVTVSAHGPAGVVLDVLANAADLTMAAMKEIDVRPKGSGGEASSESGKDVV